jgi:hypothetical protein
LLHPETLLWKFAVPPLSLTPACLPGVTLKHVS